MSSSIQWNQLITLEEHNKNYEPNEEGIAFDINRGETVCLISRVSTSKT